MKSMMAVAAKKTTSRTTSATLMNPLSSMPFFDSPTVCTPDGRKQRSGWGHDKLRN